MIRIERERSTTVLQHDARVARDDSRTECVKDAVDERHGVAVFVDHCEVRGIAADIDVARRWGVECFVRIDERTTTGRIVF